MVFTLSNLLIGDGGARIKDSGTTLSSVGGSYDFGYFTKNTGDASTTTVYNHNLGKVPKCIEFFYYPNYSWASYGYYTATSSKAIGVGTPNGDQIALFAYNPLGWKAQGGSVSSVSSSNFTITWTLTDTGSSSYGNADIAWKVSG